MIQEELAHWPLAAAGLIIGILAFLPLVAVLVPVIKRRREASIGRGFAALAASFLILVLAFVVVYLLFGNQLVYFALACIVGFVLVWIIVALAVALL